MRIYLEFSSRGIFWSPLMLSRRSTIPQSSGPEPDMLPITPRDSFCQKFILYFRQFCLKLLLNSRQNFQRTFYPLESSSVFFPNPPSGFFGWKTGYDPVTSWSTVKRSTDWATITVLKEELVGHAHHRYRLPPMKLSIPLPLSRWPGSNWRPHGPKPRMLPTAPHLDIIASTGYIFKLSCNYTIFWFIT